MREEARNFPLTPVLPQKVHPDVTSPYIRTGWRLPYTVDNTSSLNPWRVLGLSSHVLDRDYLHTDRNYYSDDNGLIEAQTVIIIDTSSSSLS